MSTGRNSSVSGVINGKLYVAGGKDTDYNALSSLEIYDPATDTWSAGPAMSTKRIGAVGDVYNGKLYVMGGMTGACNNNSEQSMEVYDPDTDTWSTLAPAPIVKSTSGTAKFINGKMYVAGGQNWCDITFSNSLIVYDPATNTWDSAKAPMPYGRAGGTSAVVDGKFLYIGGTNDDWDSVNDIFIYDLVTDSWGIYSTLPDVLHRPMANVIDNNLYVAGGRNSDWESVDTNYLLSSDFLTDPYQKETYSKISWAATTPAGTSIELLYSLNSGQNYESLGTTQGTYYLPADSSAYSLRYKAILSTDDFSVTPSLDSVTVYYATENSGLYPSSGVYTSKVIDANLNSKWETLSAESTIPTNTSISYQTRSGNSPTPDSTWSSWSDTSGSTITSPSNRYLQVKATLATTDDTQTPTLSAMTIDYTNLSVGPVLPSPPSNNNNPGNSNATAPATNEINTPTNTTPGETNGASTPTNTTNPHISMLDDILAEAKILATKDTSLLLNHLGIQADVNKEQAGLIKYQTILDLDKTISNEARLTINDFIVYGTLSTLRLGAGERAAVINSYYRAYSRLPDSEAEWNDLLKIANGRWPNERNSNIENQAKLEFNRVYGRNPEMTNNIDQNTIMVMAYGLMPRPRNLMSEQTAITTFKWIYEHSPVNALAWNIVRAVAYGGAGR